MKQILIIDDEKDILKSVNAILSEEGYKCYEALNSKDALNIFNSHKIDLVLLDVWLEDSEHDGLQILEIIKSEHTVPIILMSGHGNIDMAVSAIKKGAQEFIEKPFSSERLILSVNRTLEITKITEENISLKNKEIFDYQFIGNSPSILKIKQLINKVGPTSSRVLIQGESGTGKDVIAKEIHLNSKNSEGPFVVINAALLSPDNIELELFGSKESNNTRKGLFEKSKNGTLFIDEIGEMPLQTQAKILRVLTDRNFNRLGDDALIPVSCRIICSSTERLNKLVEDGSFRKDLFHRINVVTISLPKLIERSGDIDLLVDHFSKIYSNLNKLSIVDLKPMIFKKYFDYKWPGNIRELRNVVERHIILGDKYDDTSTSDNDTVTKNVISLPLKNARKVFEKNYILSQLERFEGNISKTANFIGMERSALHRKLKQLDINEDSDK